MLGKEHALVHGHVRAPHQGLVLGTAKVGGAAPPLGADVAGRIVGLTAAVAAKEGFIDEGS